MWAIWTFVLFQKIRTGGLRERSLDPRSKYQFFMVLTCKNQYDASLADYATILVVWRLSIIPSNL